MQTKAMQTKAMQANSMQGKLPRITAGILVGLGVALFLSYMVYLPMPEVFEKASVEGVGLIFYSLATAGSAFVAWGYMLGRMGPEGITRASMLHGTAIGFSLLGFMRLGTALFPHAPFDQLIFLPITEFIVFNGLAFKFYKS